MLKFSIVIPLFNKENYIKKTLQSVLSQSYKNFEVIVINDGSTDNSLEIIKKIKDDRIRVFNQKNQGASTARNNGVRKAKFEWVALLDADDIWFKNHLEELYSAIQKLPEAEVISTAYQIELHHNFIKQPAFSKTPPEQISYIDNYFTFSLIDPLFWTSTLAFKKSCFTKIGGFDERIKSGQDSDLICRFALKYILGYNPKITLNHKKNTENNLSQSGDIKSRVLFINKFKVEEKQSKSLKTYLDIDRYSLALQAKMQKQTDIYKSIKSEIDFKNLNSKKRFLLALPSVFLRLLKKLQLLLIKFGVYKSAFN